MTALILEVSNNFICSKNIIFLSVVKTRINVLNFPIENVQNTAAGCCDFLAQGILVRINHCTYHPFYSPKSS